MRLSERVSGVGLGLRWQILDDVLAATDDPASIAPIAFFEIAPENYMRRGGYFPAMLARVAERFPLLSHGLTLSIGGVDPLDGGYLAELRRFLDRFGIAAHSDHLCFTGVDGYQTHDLLPLPFTREAARHAAERARAVRAILGRPVAIENITYYLVPGEREVTEAAFLNEVLEAADAGLLLDLNNVVVNAKNHGDPDPIAFLSELPLSRVAQIHVAGHERDLGRLIDTHGAPVADEALPLLEWVIERTGPLPVLLERDNKIPPLRDLVAEAARVREVYDRGLAAHAARTAAGRAAKIPEIATAPPVMHGVDDSRRDHERGERSAPGSSLAEIQRGMVAEILSPQGSGVYRTLVRRGLGEVLRHQLPRTARHLGERWDAEVRRSLDEALPRSRYLRDTAFAFARRAFPRWSSDPSLPPFIVDLARYELLAFEVRNAPDDLPIATPEPLALDRRVTLSRSARVARFAYAVHALPDDEASLDAPVAEPARLCAYRDEDMEMCTLDLTPSAAEILERLAQGDALGAAVSGAAAACEIPLDPAFLQDAASFLGDLAARGVIRGPA